MSRDNLGRQMNKLSVVLRDNLVRWCLWDRLDLDYVSQSRSVRLLGVVAMVLEDQTNPGLFRGQKSGAEWANWIKTVGSVW